MKSYDHGKIEKRWQAFWSKNKLYVTSDTPKKDPAQGRSASGGNFYLLVEFPYPSGNLHVGHWYAFAVPDILARTLRMQGKNVLYPMGFDAFGLPAENAAIKNKLNPRKWTLGNIAYMKKQIASMGTSFDWSREVVTCDPAYYKWTQWLFLQLFKKSLAYQKETAVNWCPKDKTVLANEQVVTRSTSSGQAGVCERCGTEVVQREMLQWNVKITDYADRLIDDLAPLDWPEQIKESQRNWIGRSEGAEIDFPLAGLNDVKRIVILHCKGATPRDIYYPWLKEQLEKHGYEVQIPELPNPDEPNDEEQADFAQKLCTFDEQTAIVGHSFGGIVALRLLERGVKVQRVTFVAAAISGKFLDGKKRPTVTAACKKGFDFERIKKQAKAFVILPDVTDPVVSLSDAETLADELGGMLMKGRGVEGHFQSKREPDVLMATIPTIRVFTTRADTLFGATYLVLAPEHPWVGLALQHKILTNHEEVEQYVASSRKKTELERQAEQKEKTGVELKGVKAIHPANDAEIPVFVADYVLGSYGTGAVMAVPAHDERDFEFAKKFGVHIKEVIEPVIVRKSGPDTYRHDEPAHEREAVIAIVKHWEEDKYLCLQYKLRDLRYFVCGGIENGEGAVAAGVREIREETGYTNAKFVRQLGGRIYSHFYQPEKDRNTNARFQPLLFKLEDGQREEVSERELSLHEPQWIDADKVSAFLNSDDVAIAWKRAQGDACYGGKGILFNSGSFSGLSNEEAAKKIGEKFGRVSKQYRLRDWIVSRQRYWGVPIPIIHCPTCGAQPVPDKDLPVKLPEVKDYLPEGEGKSPLAKAKKWVAVKCPHCKGKAMRETDTLDTFVDSSWYFLRYTDPKNKTRFAGAKKLDAWMPIDLYSGGAEHTTMHVLYSRFWQKALYDFGLVKDAEPYTRRMNRSLILGPDGQKMSKSRGNVVDPDEVVRRLGADTVRMYLAFIGPYNEVANYPWNPDGVVGVRRFLERIWKIQNGDFVNPNLDLRNPNIEILLHKTIKKVGGDILALKFNTAIAQLMILLNAIEKEKSIGRAQWEIFLRLLAPFAPHISEELWSIAKFKRSVHEATWPAFDASRMAEEEMTIVVQIDGKTRGQFTTPADADKETLERLARSTVESRLRGQVVARVVVVPKRLVNFVLEK